MGIYKKRGESVFSHSPPFFPEMSFFEGSESFFHQKEVEAVDWVKRALSFVKPTCEEYGFEVLLADLTVLQDLRIASESQTSSYLVNYVVCYQELKNKPVIGKAYQEALTRMGRDQSGGDLRVPLIPQGDFYEYFYLATSIRDEESSNSPPLETTMQSAFQQKYPYELEKKREAKGSDEERLEDLKTFFLDSLKKTDENAVTLFNGTILLAFPFRRSQYQPLTTAEGTNGGEEKRHLSMPPISQNSSPGGGLFLVLKPPLANLNDAIERCADSFQLFLADAALLESSNQLDVQLKFREQIGSLVHSSATAIRSISSNNLKMAADAVLDSLSQEGGQPACRPEMEEWLKNKEYLENAVKDVQFGEKIAGAMLSFMEILLGKEIGLEENVIPQKYWNEKEESVPGIIDEAIKIINRKAELPFSRMKPLRLSNDIPLEEWRIPERYLDSQLMRGFILEIAENCSIHGKGERILGEENVSVFIQFDRNDSGDLTILIQCPLKTEEANDKWISKTGIAVRERSRDRQSFLISFAQFCEVFKCLGISSKIEKEGSQSYYRTYFRLGEMTVEEEGRRVGIKPSLGEEK